MVWVLVLCILGMALQQGLAARREVQSFSYGDADSDELFERTGSALAALQAIGLGLVLSPLFFPFSLQLAGLGLVITFVLGQNYLTVPIANLIRSWVMHVELDVLYNRIQFLKEMTVLFWLFAYIIGLALTTHLLPEEQQDTALQAFTLAAFSLSAVFLGRLVPMKEQILYTYQCRQTWLGITKGQTMPMGDDKTEINHTDN